MWCVNNTCLLCGVCFVVHGATRVVLFHLIRSRGGGLHGFDLGAVSFLLYACKLLHSLSSWSLKKNVVFFFVGYGAVQGFFSGFISFSLVGAMHAALSFS